MRHFSGLCSLLFLLPATALAGNDCRGPVTGLIADFRISASPTKSWRRAVYGEP